MNNDPPPVINSYLYGVYDRLLSNILVLTINNLIGQINELDLQLVYQTIGLSLGIYIDKLQFQNIKFYRDL